MLNSAQHDCLPAVISWNSLMIGLALNDHRGVTVAYVDFATGQRCGSCAFLWQNAVFHLGNIDKNSTCVFWIGNADLPVCPTVKDLGVTVNNLLTPCDHIAKIVCTAFQRVNLIYRIFVSRDLSSLVRAYCTYIRPLLEYNSVVWSPSNLGNIRRVEYVQRKFTKRLPSCHNLSYTMMREKLVLTTLELRRVHPDLVMCYKIVFNLTKVQFDDFFLLYSCYKNSWPPVSTVYKFC